MIKFCVILIYSFFAFSTFGQTERRFLIWNKNEVIIQPWKNISFNVAENIHFSPKQNALNQKYAELNLLHEPEKWFEYGAGFRVVKANTYPGWIQENRIMLMANFLKQYKHFGFKYSNRFEFRSIENDLHHFRYRQEFKVDFSSLTSWGMRFYTSEESFIKLNEVGFHLIRFYEGLSIVQQQHFKLKLYYALEKYKLIENWGTSDIVGLNMGFQL
ncbi:MAG TPA: DUF2490 domain-containing protein [Draconibacterium sp.]|nr:DUF2490 domain-containing protein [Draconibacterium sp.]